MNANLPPGTLPADISGSADMAKAFEAFLERLDRIVQERKDRHLLVIDALEGADETARQMQADIRRDR